MKLGLGLYRHMLTPDYLAFARQAGCTHVVVHLVDYFRSTSPDANPSNNQPTGGKDQPWGYAGDPAKLWTVEELRAIRRQVEEAGLVLEAIENLDPAHWGHVLIDGPRRAEHIENVKTTIRRMGEAGIPVLGYNFSIAGVAGRVSGPWGRGGAVTVGMDGPVDDPLPAGIVWNMIVDADAPPGAAHAAATHDQLWDRLRRFLEEVIPVAEEAGVRLAAHPDDPPLAFVRGQPRLVYQPTMYQRLINLVPSRCNGLELCVGTLAEMTDGGVYEAVDSYARQGKIAYVHLRNVTGRVPHYRETFIDEGDIDMVEILSILDRNGFDGMVIPDHAPGMSCSAPWHSGMAHALGFMAGALASLRRGTTRAARP